MSCRSTVKYVHLRPAFRYAYGDCKRLQTAAHFPAQTRVTRHKTFTTTGDIRSNSLQFQASGGCSCPSADSFTESADARELGSEPVLPVEPKDPRSRKEVLCRKGEENNHALVRGAHELCGLTSRGLGGGGGGGGFKKKKKKKFGGGFCTGPAGAG